MLKVQEIKAKLSIVKSNLPDGDFVINPYTGCSHNCLYCYARFMKRFTGHNEPWGSFVDVKINAPDLIPLNTDKYKNKCITMSSVTDPYQPMEAKYQLTRKILEKLIPLQPDLDILTKSNLILRDIDLIKQFKDCITVFSLSLLNENIKKALEPGTVSIVKRIEALKTMHESKIKTAVFISPIFPTITDWRAIIEATCEFADEYWFENLNLYPSIRDQVYGFLRNYNPQLISKYREIYSGKSDYWHQTKKEISDFCQINRLNYKIYFHHGSF